MHSFPRLHVGLLDLGHATYRDHGGAGFYIDGLRLEIEVRESRNTRLMGLEQLDAEGQHDLRAAVSRMRAISARPKLAICLRNVPPQHVGLGTKTAVILGTLKAIDLALNSNLGNRKLQELSGRGGTSGIGINAFFCGGLIVDCGHPASKETKFAPSSSRVDFRVPPVVCRFRIPSDWRFHLVLLRGRRLASRAEVLFFRENTPIPAREVLLSMAALYHGVVPAVVEADLKLLKRALYNLRSTGFKARELQNQADPVKDFLKEVDEKTGLAVGMSSLGPLVYAVGVASDSTGHELIKELAAKYGGRMLGVFRGRNQGYEVVK